MKVGIHDGCACVPCLEGAGPGSDRWREDIELSLEKENPSSHFRGDLQGPSGRGGSDRLSSGNLGGGMEGSTRAPKIWGDSYEVVPIWCDRGNRQ